MMLVWLFLALFVIGVVAIFSVVYLVLLPYHTMRRAEEPFPHARCVNCDLYIKGCGHVGGVPSTWVHVASGSSQCEDGKGQAYHR
jgi:hypothetical protein